MAHDVCYTLLEKATKLLDKTGKLSKKCWMSAEIRNKWPLFDVQIGANVFDQSSASTHLAIFPKFWNLYWCDTQRLYTSIDCVSVGYWHAQVRANCSGMWRTTLTWQHFNKNITVGFSSQCAFRKWQQREQQGFKHAKKRLNKNKKLSKNNQMTVKVWLNTVAPCSKSKRNGSFWDKTYLRSQSLNHS